MRCRSYISLAKFTGGIYYRFTKELDEARVSSEPVVLHQSFRRSLCDTVAPESQASTGLGVAGWRGKKKGVMPRATIGYRFLSGFKFIIFLGIAFRHR